MGWGPNHIPPEKDVKLSNRKDICACQVDSVNPVTLML